MSGKVQISQDKLDKFRAPRETYLESEVLIRNTYLKRTSLKDIYRYPLDKNFILTYPDLSAVTKALGQCPACQSLNILH
jgi:hypothetical protein